MVLSFLHDREPLLVVIRIVSEQQSRPAAVPPVPTRPRMPPRSFFLRELPLPALPPAPISPEPPPSVRARPRPPLPLPSGRFQRAEGAGQCLLSPPLEPPPQNMGGVPVGKRSPETSPTPASQHFPHPAQKNRGGGATLLPPIPRSGSRLQPVPAFHPPTPSKKLGGVPIRIKTSSTQSTFSPPASQKREGGAGPSPPASRPP